MDAHNEHWAAIVMMPYCAVVTLTLALVAGTLELIDETVGDAEDGELLDAYLVPMWVLPPADGGRVDRALCEAGEAMGQYYALTADFVNAYVAAFRRTPWPLGLGGLFRFVLHTRSTTE